jgi:hypothetical protein
MGKGGGQTEKGGGQIGSGRCQTRGGECVPDGGRVVTRMITDGRTMAAGSSVTYTHCSVRYEVTWGKTLAFAPTGSIHAMDAKGLHKGSSNIPFSLPSSPWPREATVCMVHFVVRGVLFWSYLSFLYRSSFSLLSLLKTILRSLLLILQ